MATVRRSDIKPMTLEEFLEFEQKSEVRHEYVEGAVYAFAGGTFRHAAIAGNIAFHLRLASISRGCMIFGSDVLFKAASRILYYPDVTVTCEPEEDTRRLVVTQPCFIAEVLSRSTEIIDLREKLIVYRNIPSLMTLIYVEPNRQEVFHHYRLPDGSWTEQTVTEGSIDIPCLQTSITIDQIYEALPD